MDSDRFAAFLAPDCVFRFGNLRAVEGRSAVRDFVAGYFGALGGVRHRLVEHVEAPGRIALRGFVTCVRNDGSTLKVPFANVFRMEGSLVRDDLVFADNSALFA